MEGSQPKSTNLNALPQELITAILVRLPLNNILQLKSVSKYWLSLVSSPLFAKTHLKFSSSKDLRMLLVCSPKIKYCYVSPLFDEHLIPPFYLENPDPFVRWMASLHYRASTEAFDLVHPVENPNPSIIIAGSVNGLICLRERYDRGLILWNPSTRQVKQVPDLIPPDTNGMFGYMFMYGFGYDEVHDDYKIVAINHNGPAIGLIYSLKSDSWRNLDVFKYWVQYDESAKLVNGKVHCVTGTTFTTRGDGWGIMSIDLVDEKCGKVELPCYEKGEKDVSLGVLGSDLCMLCTHIRNHERTHHDVWVMKEYGVKESWTKLYSVEYREAEYYLTAPLCMSNKGESLFVFGSYVMIYSPEKKQIRYPKIINAEGDLSAEPYIESLVSPILQNEPMT